MGGYKQYIKYIFFSEIVVIPVPTQSLLFILYCNKYWLQNLKEISLVKF